MSALEPLGLATRFVLFAAVLTVVGAAAFRFLVVERRPDAGQESLAAAVAGRAAWVGLVAASVVLAAAAGRLALQLRDLADPESPLWPQARALLLRTTWGKAFFGQVAAAAAAIVAFASARRGTGAAWFAALGSAALLALTPAFSGHAIGSERLVPLAVAADVLHVLAAGTWMGGVVVLAAVVRLPRARGLPERAGPMVARFSPVALTAAGVAALTGIAGGLLHAGPPLELLRHGYGRALVLKIALVCMVAVLGAFNWRRAGPQLLRDHDERPMLLSMRVELAAAALVVLATAVLVVTPPFGER